MEKKYRDIYRKLFDLPLRVGDKVKILHTDYRNSDQEIGTILKITKVYFNSEGKVSGYDVGSREYPYGLFYLPKEIELVGEKTKSRRT